MATPNRIMTGNAPQEVQMNRLSKSLQEQLGVRLEHSDLKKLGYRAEKRPNNPNTYYKVPGLTANIENCPKVVKYIKQVFLQNKKQELEKLLGKGVTPKVPPSTNRRAAAAADAAPADQGDDSEDDDDSDEDEDEEEDSSEEEELEEVVEGGTDDSKGNKAPAGFVYITGEKQDKVLDGMASYIAATTHLKGMTGPDLFAKGLRTVEESRPMAPGERMRHAFVWWPGRMEEPLRCAQYIFAAKNLLDIPKAREALGLPPLPLGKPAAGSASVPAKKRPSSATEGMLTPPASSSAAAAAKRTRTSAGEPASKTPVAPASAPPATNAAGRSSKVSQAAAGGSASGAGSGAAAGVRASQFPVSPTQSGAAAAGGSGGAAAGKTRGSLKAAAAAAAAGSSGAAASGKAAAADAAAVAKLGAGNQQVLDSVDDAVKLLGEALDLARSLPPSVLNSLPSVFTAGLDGTLQEFLSAAVAMQEGLKADKELLISMAGDYAAELASGGSSSALGGAAAAGSSSSRSRAGAAAAAAAESHYRRPYLAFRAALGSCAGDAHAWLQAKQQREMIARLEGLCQIKQQLEDKASQEAQMRQEQQAMRQQKEKLEQELKAYKERLKQMEEEARRKSSGAAAGAAGQHQAGRGDAAGGSGGDQKAAA